MKLIQLPANDIRDVPRALRNLADDIERGEYGDSHNVGWVVDCGDARLEIGMAGAAAEAGITAYYLFGKAMRKLEA